MAEDGAAADEAEPAAPAAPDCSRPAGALRRAIQIESRPGEVRAAVEDDYHHFRVRVRHDGAKVTSVDSEGVRIPWTACGFAGEDWSGFVGLPLPQRSTRISRLADMRAYCTHMYELAGLAMAAAARGVSRRRYDAFAPYGARSLEPSTLRRDGEVVFAWTSDGETILGPDPFTGLKVRAGFSTWADANLDPDCAEAALVLRRAIFLRSGRTANLDAQKSSHGGAVCYATQPSRAPTAYRMVGSTQDFEDRPEALLATDQDWLAFA